MSDEPRAAPDVGDPDEAWLMDGTGEPSPAVRRAAQDLAALRARPAAGDAPRERPAGALRMLAPLAAAAAMLVAVGVGSGVLVRRTAPAPSPSPSSVMATANEWTDAAAGAAIPVGGWIDTGDSERRIALGDVSEVTLAPRSRVQVRANAAAETRLYLERGRLDAFVAADAHPRFFQVDTDATRCIDLGCRYTLEVDDRRQAVVRVTLGQVAFEDGGREVYVPAGARCVAVPGAGAGTPRFEDADPELHAAFDAYDRAVATGAATAAREAAARAALSTVRTPRDTLAAWHVAHREPGVAEDALRTVSAAAGEPVRAGARPDHLWR